MSLGGLAIGIGMMADGAVVMVENIHRHLTAPPVNLKHLPAGRAETVLYAAKEVGRPVVFGILIIIVVFLPLLTLEGFERKMFAPLAFTISFALLGSLILSLTLVPMLCTLLLPLSGPTKDPFHIRWLKQSYPFTLAPCIRHPVLVVAVALLMLGASFALGPHIGTEFLPPLEEGSVLVSVARLPSISVAESGALALQVEAALMKFPEVTTVISRTGHAEKSNDPMGVELGDTYVMLKPYTEWTTAKTKEELVAQMRSAVAEIPGLAASFTQPIAMRVDELVSGVKSQIGIKIFGEDLDVLTAQGEAVARALTKVRGAADVGVEKIAGLAYLRIEIDRTKIARYGINVADVQEVVEVAIGGKEATKVYEGMKVFGLSVRFPESARNDIGPIRNILIPSPSGALIPLSQLAHIYVTEGPSQISRDMAQRRVIISANVTDRDLGGFVQEAKQKIAASVKLPTGYLMIWGGQFENQQRAMKRFAIVVPITIAAIFLLLFSSFNSAKQATLIILNIPFALIGGIVALVVGHFNLSVSANRVE